MELQDSEMQGSSIEKYQKRIPYKLKYVHSLAISHFHAIFKKFSIDWNSTTWINRSRCCRSVKENQIDFSGEIRG
jgi:carotenoid cleavage dioxygenase-like enzyme